MGVPKEDGPAAGSSDASDGDDSEAGDSVDEASGGVGVRVGADCGGGMGGGTPAASPGSSLGAAGTSEASALAGTAEASASSVVAAASGSPLSSATVSASTPVGGGFSEFDPLAGTAQRVVLVPYKEDADVVTYVHSDAAGAAGENACVGVM